MAGELGTAEAMGVQYPDQSQTLAAAELTGFRMMVDESETTESTAALCPNPTKKPEEEESKECQTTEVESAESEAQSYSS
jgi:hypothetical protein